MTEIRGLTPQKLRDWTTEGWLSCEQAERIQTELALDPKNISKSQEGPQGTNFLSASSYLGALIIIGTLGWFLFDQWRRVSNTTLLGICLAYVGVFSALAYVLRTRLGYPMAGGLLWTCVVWMVPPTGYSLQKYLGIWPKITIGNIHVAHGQFLTLELATIAAGLIVLYKTRFPLVIVPIATSFWLFCIHEISILQQSPEMGFDQQMACSIGAGLALMLVGFVQDRTHNEDFSFWWYTMGLLFFCIGLTFLNLGGIWGKSCKLSIHIVLGFLGIYLQRRSFFAFSAIGIVIQFGNIINQIRHHSVFFLAALILMGLSLIAGAAYLQRYRCTIDAFLNTYRPQRLHKK